MKYLLLSFFFLISHDTFAQHIEVTPVGTSSGNNSQTFHFDDANLVLQGNQLAVSGVGEPLIISQVRSFDLQNRFLGVLYADHAIRAAVVDGKGKKVGYVTLDRFNLMDETLEIRVFNDGRFLTRDNVVNFSFFEADGRYRYSVSNMSGSLDGEAVSAMAADPSGNTIVVFNPMINYGEDQGSRARVVKGEEVFADLYASRDRRIEFAGVSETGRYITMITSREGTNDEVMVFDRYGNALAHLDTEMDLIGATLSDDAGHMTIYSGNRVQVYDIPALERVGSATFNVRIAYAAYSNSDQQILALSGEPGSNNTLSNAEMHAVHLEKRSIVRTDIDFPVSFTRSNQLNLIRTGDNDFQINGLNRELSVQTRF